MNQQQDQLMFLIVLNRDDQRRSKAWLRFDIIVSDRRITIFVDFEISHCFIARRIVDLLRLKLQHIFERVRLESDKTVDVVDIARLSWCKDKFHMTTKCVVLDMKNDLILDENFWRKYRLTFNYETLELRVRNENREYELSKMKNQRSRL